MRHNAMRWLSGELTLALVKMFLFSSWFFLSFNARKCEKKRFHTIFFCMNEVALLVGLGENCVNAEQFHFRYSISMATLSNGSFHYLFVNSLSAARIWWFSMLVICDVSTSSPTAKKVTAQRFELAKRVQFSCKMTILNGRMRCHCGTHS